MWDLIILETNKYAKQKQEEKHVLGRQWSEVTVEKMKAFTLQSS